MDSRAHVKDCFPEIDLIGSDSLREKVVEAWTIALENGEFDRLDEIPGLPMIEASDVDNVTHTRGVTALARSMAETFDSAAGTDLDMDYITAGALCHDTGKAFEFAELDTGKYIGVAWESSKATIRHPVAGAGIGWSVGFPWEVVHIIATHSMEGEHVIRNQESNIVHFADYAYWGVVLEEELGMSIEELVFQA